MNPTPPPSLGCPPALALGALLHTELALVIYFTYGNVHVSMGYYSAIKRNTFESVLMRWLNLEPIIQNEINQKEEDKYCILTHTHTHTHIYIYMEFRKMILMILH